MPNNWIQALKEFNKDNKNHWCVPKKGSENYLKLQKIANRFDAKSNLSEDQAVVKIQSFFKKVKQNKEKQKEYSKQALEKYKNLVPQNTISSMMKPNPNFINVEYVRRKSQEDFEKKLKEQQKEFTKIAIEKYQNLIPQNTISDMMKPSLKVQKKSDNKR